MLENEVKSFIIFLGYRKRRKMVDIWWGGDWCLDWNCKWSLRTVDIRDGLGTRSFWKKKHYSIIEILLQESYKKFIKKVGTKFSRRHAN